MKGREMGPKMWLPALAAVVVLLVAWPAVGQERVGSVVTSVGDVTGEPAGGGAAPLAVSDDVLLDMEVRTGADSAVKFTLEPSTVVTKGPFTRTRVDRHFIDGETSDTSISLLEGFARFAARLFRGGQLKVESTSSTVGVKGTVFAVRVSRDETTTVWAFEAIGDDLTVTSKATGESVVLPSGYVTVVALGAGPTPPIPFDPKSGAAGGIVLPFPTTPPDVFDETPLPPGENDLPPDRGFDADGNPVFG